MTTLIGIKTNVGPIDAIILGSDTQLDFTDEEGKPLWKKPFYKIVHGDFWAMGHAGTVTDDVRRFYNRLTNPDKFKDFDKSKVEQMIMRAIESKRFIEIDELNANYYRPLQKTEDIPEFLMAVNKPQLNLYHIDIYGWLIPPENGVYIVLGSGREEAERYIEEKIEGNDYETSDIDLERALTLYRRSLKRAESDIFSGGPMDLIVVKKDKIDSYGRRIRKTIEIAEKKVFDEILKEETGKNTSSG